MNKEFQTVNALLNVEGFEVADERVTMDESQLASIENALADAEILRSSVAEAVELLDSVSENVKSIEGLKNKVLALKAIVDRVPMASPADAGKVAPAENEEEKTLRELNDLAVDPVNAEARSFR